MPKRIALLGSTGSIGTQTLDVISRFPAEFDVEVLTAGSNTRLLAQQARKFLPDSVVIGNTANYHQLKDALKDIPVKVFAGYSVVLSATNELNSKLVNTFLLSGWGFASNVI